jgi:hypothetical protein
VRSDATGRTAVFFRQALQRNGFGADLTVEALRRLLSGLVSG